MYTKLSVAFISETFDGQNEGLVAVIVRAFKCKSFAFQMKPCALANLDYLSYGSTHRFLSSGDLVVATRLSDGPRDQCV